MKQQVVQVDAFTNMPFTGNPAAVCVMDGPAPERWMQDVAKEMALSETAFLYPQSGNFRLRWFTPAVEVDLCGHATLASAHALWEMGHIAPDAIARFTTKSGILTCVRRGEWIEMDFPLTPAVPEPPPAGLLECLRVEAEYVGRSLFDYLVVVASEELVRGLQPDFMAMAEYDVRGVIVTAEADDPNVDFVSRYFAPRAGVNEDPVTGSTHSCLAPYWSARLDRPALEARQLSARGGRLRTRIDGERVKILGQAVTVITGDLLWSDDNTLEQ